VTLFLLPLMFITVMSLALAPLFRGPTDNAIKLPVVMDDHSAQAQQALDRLKGLDGFTIETQTTPQGESTRALTRADAEVLIKEGRRVAALIVPSGFGAALAQGQATAVILLQDPAQSNTAAVVAGAVRGVLSTLQGQAQAARGADALMVPFEDAIRQLPPPQQAQFKFADLKAQALAQAEQATSNSMIKVDAQNVAANHAQTPGVYEQNVPGYSVMFVFFIVSYVAGSILTEKRDGTFRRLMAAPISKSALLAGKLLPNFVVGFAQVAIMFGIGHFVFGMKLGGDFLALVLVTTAVAAAATGLGILVAALAKSEQQVSGLGTLVILTLAALGGSMVPLWVMPDFMQTLAKLTPHAWALTAYQNIIVRGYGTLDVLPQVAVLLGFAAVFFGVALWRFRWEG
jgi:ABC-2 type transport system permease protein